MAINKNFVVKNGIEVNTNLIVADTDSNKVGIGTTVPEYTLHVFEGAGIGVTNITVTGISTNLDELNVGVGGTTLTVLSNATAGIAGSVGVGTDAPGYLLEVHSPVTSGQTALYVRGDMVVTGDINIDDISIGDLNVSGISTFVGNVIIGTGATVGFGSTAFFKDHAKAIFGDDEDLKVYHDGSNSYISDTGTGGLIVGSNSLTIKNAALNETQAVFTENGSVELYHDNGKRFETNAIGVEVSGTLQSTGITTLASSGGITTTGGDLYVGGDLYINEDIVLDTNLNILGIATVGSIHVTGISTLDGTVNGPNLTNSVVVGTGLSVHGSATGVAVTLAGAGGITTTGGDFYVGGDLYISEDVVLDTNLNILGIATIGTLQVSSTSGINTISSTVQSSSKDTGALVIEGGVGIEKNLFVGGGAEVTGITTITGTLDANGALDVDGHTELDDVNVSGASTFTGAADFNGAVDIDGHTELDDVNIAGFSTFASKVDINAQVDISTDILVGGASTFTGAADFNGAVDIDGHTELDDVNVSGTATITTFNVGTAGQTLVGITTILDEDNMASDSAAALATQQSIKAYVDSQVTASDLDFQGDSGGALSVDLDSQTFTIAGTSNEIETSGSGQTLTIGLPNDVTIGQDLTVTRNVSIADSIFHTGDTDTALRFPSADTFTVETGGAENARFTSSSITFKAPDGGSRYLFGEMGNSASAELSLYNSSDAQKVRIAANNSTFFNGGNVGINTTPGTLLEIQGASGKEATVTFNREGVQSSNDGVIGEFLFENATDSVAQISVKRESAADDAYIQVATQATGGGLTERVRITSIGEVLVGSAYSVGQAGIVTAAGYEAGDDQRIKLGNAEDLLLYHDGSNSYLINETGDLNVRNLADDKDVMIQSDNGSGGFETYIQADGSTRAAKLFNSGSVKLETTSSGVINTGITTFSSTSHIKVPSGTTGQRPSAAVAGDFRYNTTTGGFEGYTDEWGAIAGGGGASESDTSVSSTSATSIYTTAHATNRSVSAIIQITQGSSYQVGRYLVIHDGTTATIVEESAVATGDMLGSFTADINGSNLRILVNMASASSATVTILPTVVTV